MLITCPSCASDYELPTDRIGVSGRKVRCASCRESWFVASPDDNPDPNAERPALESEIEAAGAEIMVRPLPPPDPAERRARRGKAGRKGKPAHRRAVRRKPPPSPRRKLANLLALVVLALIPPLLFAFRDRVVEAAPGTAALYARIGVPVNLVGLSFANVRSTLSEENDAPVLEVSGEIFNDGRIARPVPWLQISLESERGISLYRWSAKAVEGDMAVGQTAPFRVRLTQPPAAASKVQVSFQENRARRAAAAD